MPKINLPELQALAEYLTKKVPSYGMFSTLKGMIENSPQPVHTAQEWQGILKPGQIASRAGVDFPLKQEELDYAKIPNFLSQFQPGERISRDQLLSHYMANAPEFNLHVGSPAASEGQLIEQRMLKGAGIPADERISLGDPTEHAAYSHAQRGGGNESSSMVSPFGSDRYKVSVTTSPDFGEHGSHFTPQDISWHRSNQLPTEVPNLDNPSEYTGPTMRMIEEIQSDRHQHAIRPGTYSPTPEQATDLQARLAALAQRFPARDIIEAVHNPQRVENSPVLQDPDYITLMKGRREATPRLGYRDPNDPDPQKLNDQIREMEGRRLLTFDTEGRIQQSVDPDIQAQIQRLAAERDRLMNKIPDTPFKTTQGYASMEMRKALNDAVQAGDTGLGLASGADQYNFYGRRFNPKQKAGQEYAYDTSYPPLLRKLAKQYGADFGPMDVKLKNENPQSSAWPPYPIVDLLGEEGSEPTLENFLNHVATGDKEDELNYFSRLRNHMRDYDIQSPAGSDDYSNLWRDANRARSKQQDIEYRANEEAENDNPDEDFDVRRQRVLESPEYQDAEQKYQAAKKKIIDQHLAPMFSQYETKFKPMQVDEPVATKTVENTIQLTPEVIERAKKAGVPIWALTGATVGAGALGAAAPDNAQADTGMAEGGITDHVALARHLGGGGEVKTAMSIGEMIEQFLNHYHDFMRGPIESLTPEAAQQTATMAEALRAHGVEPADVIDNAMQQKPAGVVEHADGGPVTLTDLITGKDKAHGEDPSSSLTKLAQWTKANLGEAPARATTAIAKELYGTDAHGNVVFGGRAWTPEQGGTPMGLLDTISSLPANVVGLGNLAVKLAGINGPADVKAADKAAGIDENHAFSAPEWSEDASKRVEALRDRVNESTGLGKPKGLLQNVASSADAVIPIPGLAAEKGAGALQHLLGFVGGVDARAYPKVGAVQAGLQGTINNLIDKAPQQTAGQPAQDPLDREMQDYMIQHATHPQANMEPEDYISAARGNAGGMADGGQPEDDGTQPSPNEDELLTQMLQMRAMTQRLPTYEVPQHFGGGGEVGIAEKLAQLFARLTERSEPAMASASAAPARQLTSKDLNIPPPDIAGNLAAISPEMKAHVEDILSRKWTADLPGKLYQGIGAPDESSAVTDAAMENANKASGGSIHPKIAEMLSLLKAGLKPSAPSFKYGAQLADPRSYPELQPESGMAGMYQNNSIDINALLARLAQQQTAKAPPAAAPPAAESAAKGGRFKRMHGSPALYTTVPGTSGVDGGGADDSGGGGGMADGGDVDWDTIRARLHVLQHPMIEGTPSKVPPPPAVTNNGPPAVTSFHLDPNIIQKLMAMDAMGKVTNRDLQQSKGYEMNKSALDKLVADSKAEGTYDEHADDEILRRGGRAKHKRQASKVHGGMRARG